MIENATPPSASRMQPELPWPGLAAYTEDDVAFFFGRSRESAELLRLVQRDPFVLLTGAAGVGKTSLLLAGVFPALRRAAFLPVLVRIDFTDDTGDAPLSRQVLDALARATQAAGIDGGRQNEGDTLWEAFHRAGQRWWSARQKVIVPVLVLDQAEELFTLGRESLRRRQSTDRLLDELSQLVENRAPARVATLLETGEDKHDAFDFESAPVRVVLSVRDEVRAHVTPLRSLFPTMGRSELRLLPFSAAQAREAIAKPAAHLNLLADGAADDIVRFLGGGIGAETPIAPCLLSALGRELAIERQLRGLPAITPDLLPAAPDQLPRALYERALADMPVGARRFVEDVLVTAGGDRTSVTVEHAITHHEITPAVLAALAERQLIRFAGRAEAPRVELTSDLLCPLATQSRAAAVLTARDESAVSDRATFEQNTATLRRSAVRTRRWAILFATLATISLLAAVGGVVLWIATQEKLTVERENSERLVEQNRVLQLAVERAESTPPIPPSPPAQPAVSAPPPTHPPESQPPPKSTPAPITTLKPFDPPVTPPAPEGPKEIPAPDPKPAEPPPPQIITAPDPPERAEREREIARKKAAASEETPKRPAPRDPPARPETTARPGDAPTAAGPARAPQPNRPILRLPPTSPKPTGSFARPADGR